jgi:hypothetical protein
MQKRTLGNSHLEVSALGLGCMGMSFGYGERSPCSLFPSSTCNLMFALARVLPPEVPTAECGS